ncbi:MAG: hypothetical protein R3B54_18610 [Bdellovibrionota bacterium]
MRRQSFLVWVPATVALLLVLGALLPLEGKIGHDYYLAFTEYLIGMNHVQLNGISLPHFTASLCGGLPFFADPQSTFLSLPQLLIFFLPPHTAVFFTYLLFYAAAYIGTWFLCRRHYAYPAFSSHLAALFFVLSGFCFAHLFVGHVTHHVFLLTPWFILLAIDSSLFSSARRAAVWSLLLAYAVYSGGMHVLVLWVLLAGLFLPVWLLRPDWRFLAYATAFSLLLLPAKLIAGYFFLKNAYPMPVHLSGENPFWIFFRYFFFVPSETPLTVAFGQLAFGPWEYVGFVSKLALPASLYYVYARVQKRKHLLPFAVQFVLALLLVAVATGSLAPSFLASYHNPIKLLAVLILPLTLAFGSTARELEETLRRRFPPQTVFIAFAFLSVLLLWESTFSIGFFVTNKSGISFDPKLANTVWSQLANRAPLPPVRAVNAARGSDLAGLAQGQTSLHCAEPTYGYFQEGLHTKLQVGATDQIQEGRFNLSHPGCLLYPDFYGCKAWDRIPVSEARSFTNFISARATAWKVPQWQTALLALHACSALILIGFSLAPVALRIGRLRRNT